MLLLQRAIFTKKKFAASLTVNMAHLIAGTIRFHRIRVATIYLAQYQVQRALVYLALQL